MPTGERVGRTISRRDGATRTTSTGLPMTLGCAGEPVLPEKCTHRSQCECSCERSVIPCTEYAAVHTISAQAARRASRRLRRKPVLKSLNLRETRRHRVAVAGQVGNCGARSFLSLPARTAVEVVHQHQLDDERVRTAGESPTDPEFDPVAAFAVVEHGEERLRALGVREEALEGSEIGV